MKVKGLIKNHNWEDKSGNKHYDYSFIAEKISFLSSKSKEMEKVEEKVDNTDIFEQFGNEIEINNQFLD